LPSYFAKPPKGATLNRSHPLAGGLVCAYLFNEGGGLKLYDAVGRTNQTATATGTPTWANGPHGKAVLCNVASQLFTGGANPLSGSAIFSVSAWVNISNNSFADVVFLQCYNSGNGDGFLFKMDGGASSKFTFQKSISYSSSTAVSNAVATASKWTHLVGTCNASGLLTLYVDGVAQTITATRTGTITNTNTTTILGGTHGASRVNQGSNFLLWKNRCLTARDVQQLYADSFQMFRRLYVPDIIHSSGGGSDGVGAATGSATVSGGGASAAASAGSSAGVGAASGVGSSTVASVGSSAGVATASATGSATAAGVGSSAGTGAASSVGSSTAAAVASSAGVATVSGVGSSASSGSGVGSSDGVATVSGVGASVAASAGASAGIATASGVGSSVSSGSAAASSAGVSTASAVGASAVAAIFSAISTATVNGVSNNGGAGVDGPYRVVAASIISPGQQAGAAFTPGSAAGQIGGQT
jgi:hypothetical protein